MTKIDYDRGVLVRAANGDTFMVNRESWERCQEARDEHLRKAERAERPSLTQVLLGKMTAKSYVALTRGDEADQRDEETPVDEVVDKPAAFDGTPANPAIALDVGDTHLEFPNERALAVWLAVQERIRKSHQEEPSMTREELESTRIEKLRALNVVEVAKVLVHDQDARQISEAEFVDMISRHDPQPGETPAQTFTRHYEANTPDGALLRAGMQVTKAAEAAPYFDLQPVFVGGDAALDVNDPSQAIAQLTRIGRQKWPTASEAEAFERAFTDPANAELARKAYRRPAATSIYPMPR